MLVSPLIQPETDPPKGGSVLQENLEDDGLSKETSLESNSSGGLITAPSVEYAQFQGRLFLTTAVVSAFSGVVTTIFFGIHSASSLLVGSLFGVLYLRLLARSIWNLGKVSKNVSKIQLLVPVVLVLAASKLPQLELLPAFIGFLLFKPSMIFQHLLEP